MSALTVPEADQHLFDRTLKYALRERVYLWMEILNRFEAATDRGAELEALKAQYGGVVAISQGTLYRKREAARKMGWWGLLPKPVRDQVQRSQVPQAFVERLWKPLCEENQRCVSGAYRSLFYDHLMAGRTIPGYGQDGRGGDWMAIWMAQHPGWAVPSTCPYRPHKATPSGWSERNLRNLAPSKYELTAARIGTSAASRFLPDVPTTRVGLPFMRVVLMDDVHHDVKVKLLGNMQPQIVVEMGALELSTAHYCVFGFKPVRERDDGTKEVLRSAFTRYLICHLVCVIGYHPDGLLILGEHGTAYADDELMRVLKRRSGGKIHFGAGGIQNQPIAAGLYQGLRRGNPNIKAALESHHNLKKNDLAQLPGQKGADPEHAPEDLESKRQVHVALMKAVVALAEQRPDLYARLRSPFPEYHSYVESVACIYDRIAHRDHHRIEGWAECGHTVEEWRLSKDQPWAPMSLLDDMPPCEAETVRSLIAADPTRHNLRRMSPIEAWEAAQRRNELVRLPESAVPEILGAELGEVLSVRDDDTLVITDKYIPQRSYPVAALVVTPDRRKVLLPRKSEWLVHLNPYDGLHAYVSAPDGEYVGKAPILNASTKIDMDGLRRNMGIVQGVLNAELKKLAPVAEKRLREQYAAAAENVETLTGSDPVAERAMEAEAGVDVVADLARARSRRNNTSEFAWG